MVPTVINKDVFKLHLDLKFTVENCNYFAPFLYILQTTVEMFVFENSQDNF